MPGDSALQAGDGDGGCHPLANGEVGALGAGEGGVSLRLFYPGSIFGEGHILLRI